MSRATGVTRVRVAGLRSGAVGRAACVPSTKIAAVPIIVLLAGLALGGCAQVERAVSERSPRAHEGLDATLWVQSSAEYRAEAVQTYRLAKIRLLQGLRNKRWTAALEQRRGYAKLRPAVILDVDETVLDNAAFQAGLVREGRGFSGKAWAAWINRASAPAVPGAVDFVRFARRHHVTVFFVTNRGVRFEAATRKNLAARGIRLPARPDTLLMRGEHKGWTSDKTTRRAAVARRYRVLLLIGDDFNDLTGARLPNPAARRALATRYAGKLGRQWILLPNPLYGSWETALYGGNTRLPRDEKLKRKYDTLAPPR
jgi:5'-nucleotidase (lipoprotein e(P4) family)